MRLLVVGIMCGGISLQAQNFTGSDDFSSVSGKWTAGPVTNGGTLTVGGGLLNFTDPGLASDSSSAVAAWTFSAGSSIADWQVQIDLTLNQTQVAMQASIWNVVLTNNADPDDYFQMEYVRAQMQLNPFIRGTVMTDGGFGATNQLDVASNSIAVRASYLASSQTLTMAYDINGATSGYSFTDLVSGTVSGWSMGAGDFFTLRLDASNMANGTATNAIAPGEIFADNFMASGAAIPEPSTYAAGLGVLALLGAFLSRRFRQQ